MTGDPREQEAAPAPMIPPPRRKDDANAWMVTFTDLVALLVTFFVMLFAMSTVKIYDWQALTESLRNQLNTITESEQAAPMLRMDMPSPDRTPGTDLDYLSSLLRAQLANAPVLQGASVRREVDRIFVSLPSSLLFDGGDYTLTEGATQAVFELGGVLRNITNRVEVAGHADPRPPASRYPSNWELSLLRAQSVAAALRQAGYDGSVVARGYGHAQFQALPDTLPIQERQAIGRRVDVVVHSGAREAFQ